MNECKEIAKVRSIDSSATRNIFTRLWTKLKAEIGTGLRKSADYDEMDETQLEHRARENLAITKARGF